MNNHRTKCGGLLACLALAVAPGFAIANWQSYTHSDDAGAVTLVGARVEDDTGKFAVHVTRTIADLYSDHRVVDVHVIPKDASAEYAARAEAGRVPFSWKVKGYLRYDGAATEREHGIAFALSLTQLDHWLEGEYVTIRYAAATGGRNVKVVVPLGGARDAIDAVLEAGMSFSSDRFEDAAPRIAGAQGVTNPVLVEESRAAPVYPKEAREARVEGSVILQAVVRRDGSVGEVDVLRCSSPGMGFEEAAMEAVRTWTYEPATEDGTPVDVYFTIFIEFTLGSRW